MVADVHHELINAETTLLTVPMTDIALSGADYSGIHGDIVALLEHGRRAAARSVNALMTATYWDIGRRIVEFSQGGEGRATYGQALLERLSVDLTARFGRGFGVDNLELMRMFYQTYPPAAISASLIRKSTSTGHPGNSEKMGVRTKTWTTWR